MQNHHADTASRHIANCHAFGLDSLVIRDRVSPLSGMVRMFVARPEHELWKNQPNSGFGMTIGLHAHHCDITMVPLAGFAFNVFNALDLGRREEGDWAQKLKAYRFRSSITSEDGTGGFDAMPFLDKKFVLGAELLDRVTCLPAETLHTVFVPKGETAAWLILEGKENPDHDPVMWTDVSPSVRPDLYQRMDLDRYAEDMALLACKGVRF